LLGFPDRVKTPASCSFDHHTVQKTVESPNQIRLVTQVRHQEHRYQPVVDMKRPLFIVDYRNRANSNQYHYRLARRKSTKARLQHTVDNHKSKQSYKANQRGKC
jgi:hypothetical protein